MMPSHGVAIYFPSRPVCRANEKPLLNWDDEADGSMLSAVSAWLPPKEKPDSIVGDFGCAIGCWSFHCHFGIGAIPAPGPPARLGKPDMTELMGPPASRCGRPTSSVPMSLESWPFG